MASYLNKPGGNNIFGSSANFAEAVTTKATQIAPGGQWILYLLVILFIVLVNLVVAQNIKNNPTSNHGNKFEQLGTILPDANV